MYFLFPLKNALGFFIENLMVSNIVLKAKISTTTLVVMFIAVKETCPLVSTEERSWASIIAIIPRI